MRSATAIVQHGVRDLREGEILLPRLEGAAALLRVEACGLCGTDIASVAGLDVQAERAQTGDGPDPFPRIIGHEIVGVIEAIGPDGRRNLRVGDRVAVDPWLPCGGCRYCLAGMSMHCTGWDFSHACYGFISLADAPGLWGGYSSHVYVHPKAVVYPVPDGLSAEHAVLWNPISAGIQWGVLTPRTTIGSRVVILGAGQRGLAAAVAARAAGASQVIITGLTRDARKLELACEFGADLAIDVEYEDAVDRVRHATDGEGADVVVDTSSGSIQPVVDAVAMIAPGGRIVWAGLKHQTVSGFAIDDAIHKSAQIHAVLGTSSLAYQQALALLASGRFPLAEMQSHVFDLPDALRAVDVLAGRVDGEHAISVALRIPR